MLEGAGTWVRAVGGLKEGRLELVAREALVAGSLQRIFPSGQADVRDQPLDGRHGDL